jgi:hypothetical protein
LNYISPTVDLKKKETLVGDEFWWVGLLVLFIVWCTSQYSMNRAINNCKNSGGLARVESVWWGTGYKVICYDK